MLLRAYLINLALVVISVVCLFIYYDKSKSEGEGKFGKIMSIVTMIAFLAFIITNIVMLVYGIREIDWMLIVLAGSFLLAIIVFILMAINNDIMDYISEPLFTISILVWIASIVIAIAKGYLMK